MEVRVTFQLKVALYSVVKPTCALSKLKQKILDRKVISCIFLISIKQGPIPVVVWLSNCFRVHVSHRLNYTKSK